MGLGGGGRNTGLVDVFEDLVPHRYSEESSSSHAHQCSSMRLKTWSYNWCRGRGCLQCVCVYVCVCAGGADACSHGAWIQDPKRVCLFCFVCFGLPPGMQVPSHINSLSLSLSEFDIEGVTPRHGGQQEVKKGARRQPVNTPYCRVDWHAHQRHFPPPHTGIVVVP